MVDRLVTSAGVDLAKIDDFGKAAQAVASGTSGNLPLEWTLMEWTRGESVYCVMDANGQVIGVVDEGVGTKNFLIGAMKLRRHMFKQGMTDEQLAHFWFNIGICTVAMIVNDLITLGVMPRVMTQHVAYAPPFLDDVEAWRWFLLGYAEGCNQAGAVWGPGETAELNDLIVPGQAIFKGACWGTVPEGCAVFNPSMIQEGDVEIGAYSSGIHANGLTKARNVAARRGYNVELESGKSFGEALLTATIIYRDWVHLCMQQGLKIRYFTPITGHGWRKMMRPNKPLVHTIEESALPPVQPEFDFIGETLGFDQRTMYGTFNMGLGATMIVAPEDAEAARACGKHVGLELVELCRLQVPDDGISRVVLPSLDVSYSREDLQVR